jgi:hypothetical protein
MSRNRIAARLRKNDDYIAITKELKRLGLKHRAFVPPGKSGHPIIVITDGQKECELRVAGTPKASNIAAALLNLRRALLTAGIIDDG